MPFVPANDPALYSTMMKSMKDEWNSLFNARMQELTQLDGDDIVVSSTIKIYIGGEKNCCLH